MKSAELLALMIDNYPDQTKEIIQSLCDDGDFDNDDDFPGVFEEVPAIASLGLE